jgi:drug/metabolite transporter (DMT)-like permease
MVVALALFAAFLFGLASVLQHRAAQAAAPERSMRPGLLLDLARKPLWLAGQGAGFGAFGAQAVALSFGALSLVQPLLVTRLVFGLFLASRLSHQRLHRTEWTGAFAIVAGLGGFLLAASPPVGTAAVDGAGWLGLALVTVVPAGALTLLAPRTPGIGRAMALAAAGGFLFVATTTLTKVVGHDMRGDAAGVLTSWKLYAMAPAGIAAMLLVQSAFMAGPIRGSLSALTCVECLGAIAVGALFFHEAVSLRPLDVVVEVLGLVAVVWGIRTVTRSPVLVATLETHPETPL